MGGLKGSWTSAALSLRPQPQPQPFGVLEVGMLFSKGDLSESTAFGIPEYILSERHGNGWTCKFIKQTILSPRKQSFKFKRTPNGIRDKTSSREESMMRGRGCKAEGGEASGSWGSRPGGGLGPSCQQCGLQHSETQQ